MALGSMVTRNQFEITDDGITHKPTGYSFTRGAGENMGQLGKVLSLSEYYRPDEVKEWTRRLWLEYTRKKTLV